MSDRSLSEHRKLWVRQLYEMAEWVGFETRNKYQVQSETGQAVAFAAEQQKGMLGFLFRQFLGHWRSFEIQVFTPSSVSRSGSLFLAQPSLLTACISKIMPTGDDECWKL